jgi:hypothetical protein
VRVLLPVLLADPEVPPVLQQEYQATRGSPDFELRAQMYGLWWWQALRRIAHGCVLKRAMMHDDPTAAGLWAGVQQESSTGSLMDIEAC